MAVVAIGASISLTSVPAQAESTAPTNPNVTAATVGVPTADTSAEDPGGACDPAAYTDEELAAGAVLWGTAGNDNLQGTAADEVLCGLGGADLIDGKAGNDMIIGGAGDDTIYGGLGDDTVFAGSGVDTVDGQDGADNLNGGLGNDFIQGQDGADNINGDEGDDRLIGQDKADSIFGGPGKDVIEGTDENDLLDGGADDDHIDGGVGNDTLNGGAGYDTLDGFKDTDTCSTGEVLLGCEIAGAAPPPEVLTPQREQNFKPLPTPLAKQITADDLLGGLSVTLQTNGGLEATDIRVDGAPSYMDGSISDVMASSAYDLSVPATAPPFASGTLTIPWNPDLLGTFPSTALKIYTFDEAAQLWLPVPGQQTVNTTAGTVTATIAHFSVYALLKISRPEDWLPVFRQAPRRCNPNSQGKPIDAAVVIDTSESTTRSDPQDLRVAAGKQFVTTLRDSDRAGVIGFNSTATVKAGLTTLNAAGRSTVNAALDQTGESLGQTNLPDAVNKTVTMLSASPTGRSRVAVLLGDGATSTPYDQATTRAAAAAGIEINTVSVGTFDPTLLRSIAAGTGGNYQSVATAADLSAVYTQIARDVVDAAKDSDGDGLNDCIERNGLFTPGRATFTTDPTATAPVPASMTSDPLKADTDGDGLSDGAEVEYKAFSANPAVAAEYSSLVSAGYAGYYRLKSSSRLVDTDGDTVTDPAEYAAGTNPLRRESDYLGIEGLNIPVGTLFQPDRYATRPIIDTILYSSKPYETAPKYLFYNTAVRYNSKRDCVDVCPWVVDLAARRPNTNGAGFCFGDNHGTCVTDESQRRDIVEQIRRKTKTFAANGDLQWSFVKFNATYLCFDQTDSSDCNKIRSLASNGASLPADSYSSLLLQAAALPFPAGRMPVTRGWALGKARLRNLSTGNTAAVVGTVTVAAALGINELADALQACGAGVPALLIKAPAFIHPCSFMPIFSPGGNLGEATKLKVDAIALNPARAILKYQEAAQVRAAGIPRDWYTRVGQGCDKYKKAEAQKARPGVDLSCDELPYYSSTTSGNRGVNAGLRFILASDNKHESGPLSAFIGKCKKTVSNPVPSLRTNYLVVPLPSSPTTVFHCG